jgi:hypothetical protein
MKRAANGGRDAFLLCIGDERTQKLDSGAALGRLATQPTVRPMGHLRSHLSTRIAVTKRDSTKVRTA